MTRSLIGLTVTVFRINLLGLGSALLGAAAWFTWPSTAEWWGFGVLSVFLAFGAFQMLVQALGTTWRMIEQQCAIAALSRIGGEAKSSQMAATDQLKKTGMLDG